MSDGVERGTSGQERPLLRVLTPSATPEEVAAVVAVVTAVSGGEEPPPRPRSEWGSPRRRLRATFPHGPGAWRASGLPR